VASIDSPTIIQWLSDYNSITSSHHRQCLMSWDCNPKMTTPSLLQWCSVGNSWQNDIRLYCSFVYLHWSFLTPTFNNADLLFALVITPGFGLHHVEVQIKIWPLIANIWIKIQFVAVYKKKTSFKKAIILNLDYSSNTQTYC